MHQLIRPYVPPCMCAGRFAYSRSVGERHATCPIFVWGKQAEIATTNCFPWGPEAYPKAESKKPKRRTHWVRYVVKDSSDSSYLFGPRGQKHHANSSRWSFRAPTRALSGGTPRSNGHAVGALKTLRGPSPKLNSTHAKTFMKRRLDAKTAKTTAGSLVGSCFGPCMPSRWTT